MTIFNQTPEKSRTPSGGERKRKRKMPENHDHNSGEFSEIEKCGEAVMGERIT